jgi:hypothetical protein
MEYRQKLATGVWHWVRNCSQWPTVDCATAARRPDTGKMCEECREKQAAAEAALISQVQCTPRPPKNTKAKDHSKTHTRGRES